MADNLIQIRGVQGGTIYYDQIGQNGFRNVSYRAGRGKMVKKLVCYTGNMLQYLRKWEGKKEEVVPCLCGPGFAHNHPPLTLDEIRYLYIRHGIRLRCMLFGSGSGREIFARVLCSRYFGSDYDKHIENVMAVLESSDSSLREGYLRGVLMARGDGAYGDGRVTSSKDSRLQVMVLLLLC